MRCSTQLAAPRKMGKRRLRLGEAAAHHRGLHRSIDPHRETTKAVLSNCEVGTDRSQVDRLVAGLFRPITLTSEDEGVARSYSAAVYSEPNLH